jgi:hypothetical protein
MTFELTPEQRTVLRKHPGEALHVEDPELHKVYLVIEQGVMPTIDETYVRTKLTEADAAIADGDVGAWDPDVIKTEGRRRLKDESPTA